MKRELPQPASRWTPSVATTVAVMAVLICVAIALAAYLGAPTVPGPDLPLPR